MSNIKDQLIRLGYQRKDLRTHIKPVLNHLKRQRKSASSNWYEDRNAASSIITSGRNIQSYEDPLALDRAIDDMDDKEVVTRHALLFGEPMSEKAIIDTFKTVWKLEPRDRGGRGGLPRHKGDRVLFDASSCKIPPAEALADEFDGKTGTIVETEKEDPGLNEAGEKYGDVMIQIDNGPIIRYPQGQRKRSIGLKVPKKKLKHKIEAVYLAGGGSPTRQQIQEAQDYVDRAKGRELRSKNYYSGFTAPPAFNKESGDLYFGVYANAQRNWRERTTMSLRTGTVLYLGHPNKRKNIESKRDDLRKLRQEKRR